VFSYSYIIQDKRLNVQAERLRRVDTKVKRQSDLIGNYERESRRGFSARFKDLVKGILSLVTVCIIQDQDPVLSWVSERLGVAMKQAEDTILGNYLLSAASQYNCQKGVNGDNPTEPTLRDFANVNAALDTANAFKFLSGKQGEDRFGSAPIRSAFFCLAHTLLESSFDVLNGFIHAWNYPNQNDVLYSEYGSVTNFRILTSSNAIVQSSASTNGRDVYNNMIVAREAYAHIEQDGYSSQLIYRPPIFSGPLALNGTLGVKFAQAQVKQGNDLSKLLVIDLEAAA
jgi:N4-gp56 family major capsid protein